MKRIFLFGISLCWMTLSFLFPQMMPMRFVEALYKGALPVSELVEVQEGELWSIPRPNESWDSLGWRVNFVLPRMPQGWALELRWYKVLSPQPHTQVSKYAYEELISKRLPLKERITFLLYSGDPYENLWQNIPARTEEYPLLFELRAFRSESKNPSLDSAITKPSIDKIKVLLEKLQRPLGRLQLFLHDKDHRLISQATLFSGDKIYAYPSDFPLELAPGLYDFEVQANSYRHKVFQVLVKQGLVNEADILLDPLESYFIFRVPHGVKIRVDDQDVSSAEWSRYRVSAGFHEVHLQWGDQDFFRTIEAQAGRDYRFSLDLDFASIEPELP